MEIRQFNTGEIIILLDGASVVIGNVTFVVEELIIRGVKGLFNSSFVQKRIDADVASYRGVIDQPTELYIMDFNEPNK